MVAGGIGSGAKLKCTVVSLEMVHKISLSYRVEDDIMVYHDRERGTSSNIEARAVFALN